MNTTIAAQEQWMRESQLKKSARPERSENRRFYDRRRDLNNWTPPDPHGIASSWLYWLFDEPVFTRFQMAQLLGELDGEQYRFTVGSSKR